jgi:ubiquinone/menaquinone biosynthesis C-methylase UbiE
MSIGPNRPNPSAKFWDRIAERYAKQPIADESRYEEKLEMTREFLRPDMEVLEIGCGTGTTSLAHAPFVNHIRATDISAKMIAIAQAKARTAHVDNVTFEQATLETLNISGDSVDVVLALNVLHLLDDWRAALGRIQHVLKRGGVFVSSTPCLGDSSMRYIKWIAPVGRLLGLMPMVYVFTSAELVAELEATGFSIDRQKTWGSGRSVFIVARKL